jgi:hypothetical protein
MTSKAVSRLALIMSAALFTAACSTSDGPSKINAPDAVSADFGVATAGTITVCIDPTSTPGSYTITPSAPYGVVAGDNMTAAPVVLNATPGTNCADVFTRPANPPNFEEAGVTLTASTGVAGTFSYTCIDDVAEGDPLCVSGTSGVNGSTSEANSAHGSNVTFLFVADPVVTDGCTLTQGWWKNQGKAAADTVDFDGGINNGLTILKTPVKGNPYIELAHQYIAASLNIAAGASIDGDAQDAYDDATAYFAVASSGTPLPGSYTEAGLQLLVDALELYNEGLSPGNPAHCDAEVIL